MEIHEITKRQRTDEGILDTVKSAVNSAKTGYNAVSNKYNKVKDKVVAAGDAWQDKQWDKKQDAINKQASDAAKVLARKGFNVDTATPLAKAQTPTRIKQQQQQKVSQLQQAFDQEFDVGYELNPNAAEIYAQQKAAATPTAPKSKLQQTIAAQNKQMSPQSGIKEAQVNTNKLATMKSRARAPGVTQTGTPGKKSIATDFITWINQQIPGLANVSADIKAKLNGIFAQMKTLKGNPKAIDQAFQQYASIALNAVGHGPQGAQGQQVAGKVSPSAHYAQQAIASKLGINPDAINKLQQRMAQNQETISNTHTGSPTIDTLIQAVAKK